MGKSIAASGADHIVCPVCETGELRAGEAGPATCSSCKHSVNSETMKTLLEILALPDALGSHACECGHPEMRLLPDGVYHCPSCASEVLPFSHSPGHAASPNR